MPGIFGIVSKGQTCEDALRIQFDQMARLLKHFDYYETEKCEGEGFIIGRIGIPFRGYRSIRSDTQSHRSVVFDGYIYGWQSGRSRDDAYLREPVSIIPLTSEGKLEDIPERINGSFSLALVDSEDDRILLATDKLGFRPIYYYQNESIVAFASEIKAFLGVTSFRPALNIESAADYFNYGFVMGGRTLYENVFHLYPASIIEIKDRKLKSPNRYWERRFSEDLAGDENVFMQRMLDVAQDTFCRQMGSHNDFIIALSGGMDSRVVAHLAAKSNRNYCYFSHGLEKSEDAVIANRVARALNVRDHYAHHGGDPECYSRFGAWTTWLVDGMADMSCCFLTSVLDSYKSNPLQFEFLNSIYTGAMNFACAYGRAADIRTDMTLNQKIDRAKQVLDARYCGDSYYESFSPAYGELFKQSYDLHLKNEFQKHEDISSNFVNQMDNFFLETRVLRLSNQYDLNRFFYHDHFSLIDDESFKLYLTMPMSFKVDRMLYKRMYQRLLPAMAKITYQKTGVDLFSEPSKLSVRLAALRNHGRYYLGRLSRGKVDLYDYHNYTQPNQWYRRYESNQKFYETILLDKRTLARGYFSEAVVAKWLQKQIVGANNFEIISSLATFELFNRYFIDRDDPPRANE